MALLTPRTETITGASLTGADGTSNRTYTLVNLNSSSTGIQITVSSTPLTPGSTYDFTFSSGIITFLNVVFNDQPININYFTSGDSSTTSSGLGSATAVRRILNKTTAELDDDTVNAFIEEGVRKIKGKYYKNYMLDKVHITSIRATGQANRVYETYFPLKDDTSTNIKVYYNGAILTLTTDYTIDFDESTITINDNYPINSGNSLAIFYIPEIFDDFVNYLAAKRIVDRGLVDLQAGAQGGIIYNNIKETLKEYEDMVKYKPHFATFNDHGEDSGIF